MQFAVSDINRDALEISVFDKDLFSPNGKCSTGYSIKLVHSFIPFACLFCVQISWVVAGSL